MTVIRREGGHPQLIVVEVLRRRGLELSRYLIIITLNVDNHQSRPFIYFSGIKFVSKHRHFGTWRHTLMRYFLLLFSALLCDERRILAFGSAF